MNILALDTSSKACSIALSIDDKIFSRHVIAPMQQAQTILPLINELLAEARIQLNDIQVIAFGRGPGSFTGLRIAVSVAQGLAFALNIPLISISSLAILAQSVYEEKSWQNVLVATDARLNEIYTGAYQIKEGLAVLTGIEKVMPPEDLTMPENNPWHGAGDGWLSYSSKISCQVVEIDGNILPNAKALIKLALPDWHNGRTIRPEQAMPVYLRDEVAVKSNKR